MQRVQMHVNITICYPWLSYVRLSMSVHLCACVCLFELVCALLCMCVHLCARASMFVRLDRGLGFASRGLGFASRGLGFASSMGVHVSVNVNARV